MPITRKTAEKELTRRAKKIPGDEECVKALRFHYDAEPIKLQGQRNIDWGNRAQFMAMAAKLMRRILLDHATAHRAAKRGHGAVHLELDAATDIFERQEISVVSLNEALEELETFDPRQAQVVELRFFGGLSVEETAEALAVSPATVKREWSVAKLWLKREMAVA